jgi:hypothetical protein
MNKLQKLARLIQFTVKLICFSFIMFEIYIINDVFDGKLLTFFFALIIMVIIIVVVNFVLFTKWENLFKNKK